MDKATVDRYANLARACGIPVFEVGDKSANSFPSLRFIGIDGTVMCAHFYADDSRTEFTPDTDANQAMHLFECRARFEFDLHWKATTSGMANDRGYLVEMQGVAMSLGFGNAFGEAMCSALLNYDSQMPLKQEAPR